jgi:hypothetical protein
MKKKVIRLTESDLVKLVQRVLKEDESQSAMKTAIMSTVSDLDTTGIDIDKHIDMETREDDTITPEENPQLKSEELNVFYQMRNEIGKKVMDMCHGNSKTPDGAGIFKKGSGVPLDKVIRFLKGKYNELKGKIKKVNEQSLVNHPTAFMLGSAAIIALLIFLIKAIVSARSNRFCNRWERRMRTMPGFR